MKRTLLDLFGKEQSAKVTRIGITVTPSDEASTSSNEPSKDLPPLSPTFIATCSGSTIDRRRWVRFQGIFPRRRGIRDIPIVNLELY